MAKTDDYVLVAKKGGSIRALTVIKGMSCLELADTLRDWAEFDSIREPLVMLRSEAMRQIREEDAGRAALEDIP